MAVNVYDTSGAVVGHITGGADATNVTGLISNKTYGGVVGNKSVVAQHVNGSYYLIQIVSAVAAGDMFNFSGKVTGIAVNFAPKPFATVDSVVEAVKNTFIPTLPAAGANPLADVPWWAYAAGAGVLALLIVRK